MCVCFTAIAGCKLTLQDLWVALVLRYNLRMLWVLVWMTVRNHTGQWDLREDDVAQEHWRRGVCEGGATIVFGRRRDFFPKRNCEDRRVRSPLRRSIFGRGSAEREGEVFLLKGVSPLSTAGRSLWRRAAIFARFPPAHTRSRMRETTSSMDGSSPQVLSSWR